MDVNGCFNIMQIVYVYVYVYVHVHGYVHVYVHGYVYKIAYFVFLEFLRLPNEISEPLRF